MEQVTFTEWKQLRYGIDRGLIKGHVRANRVDGDHCMREFFGPDGDVFASMCVYGGNSDISSHECQREFLIHPAILKQIEHIFVPTQEQQDIIDDPINDEGIWEHDGCWQTYALSVKLGKPDSGWIPEGFPQEILDAFNR